MNDYKELIEKFREKKNDGWQKDGSYQMQIITVQDVVDAADAIEQLVKERDEQRNYIAELHEEVANLYIALDSERNSADEWQHDYFELLKKFHQLEDE